MRALIFGRDLRHDFFAEDAHIRRRFDADANAFAIAGDDHDADSAFDENGVSDFAAQNQHGYGAIARRVCIISSAVLTSLDAAWNAC